MIKLWGDSPVDSTEFTKLNMFVTLFSKAGAKGALLAKTVK